MSTVEAINISNKQRDDAESLIRQMRRVLLEYTGTWGRHCGSCCTMIDGKIAITDESCICGCIVTGSYTLDELREQCRPK